MDFEHTGEWSWIDVSTLQFVATKRLPLASTFQCGNAGQVAYITRQQRSAEEEDEVEKLACYPTRTHAHACYHTRTKKAHACYPTRTHTHTRTRTHTTHTHTHTHTYILGKCSRANNTRSYKAESEDVCDVT